MLLIIASIFGRLNKIRVKSKMSRNEKKGHGGKHTQPKKWSGARRPAGPATTALQCINNLFFQKQYETRSTLVNSLDPDQLASLVNSVDPDQLASEEAS